MVACEYPQDIKGCIHDKVTKLPIDSVLIGKGRGGPDTSNRERYSHKDGSFHIHVGLTLTSEGFELCFRKNGYKTIVIKHTCTSSKRFDTIHLEKANQ